MSGTVLNEGESYQSPVAQLLVVQTNATAQACAAAAAAAAGDKSISNAALKFGEEAVPVDTAMEGATGGVEGGYEHV
jgi:hypothetical protein